MKVPAYYTEFLQRPETFGYLASINRNGFCDVCRTCMVSALNEEYIKIIYMPDLAPNLLDNLQANPEMTATLASAFTFECYQFKGTYHSHEDLSADDKKRNDNYLEGMMNIITDMGFDLGNIFTNKYNKQKVQAVVMKVNAIFEQTPKNGTGKNIDQLNPAS